jgi:hypothetical protein
MLFVETVTVYCENHTEHTDTLCGLGKNPPNVARQRLGTNVTTVTNTHATIEESLDASFAMWPMSYQRK